MLASSWSRVKKRPMRCRSYLESRELRPLRGAAPARSRPRICPPCATVAYSSAPIMIKRAGIGRKHPMDPLADLYAFPIGCVESTVEWNGHERRQTVSPSWRARMRACRPSANGRVASSIVFTCLGARRVTNSRPRDSHPLRCRNCCTRRRNALECAVSIAQPRRNTMMPRGNGRGKGMGVSRRPTMVTTHPPVRIRSFFIAIRVILSASWVRTSSIAMTI